MPPWCASALTAGGTGWSLRFAYRSPVPSLWLLHIWFGIVRAGTQGLPLGSRKRASKQIEHCVGLPRGLCCCIARKQLGKYQSLASRLVLEAIMIFKALEKLNEQELLKVCLMRSFKRF